MDFSKKNEEWMDALMADFPPEAHKPDTSRGFGLTSTKAMFVIERLNQTFGLLGHGWRFAHSKTDEWTTKSGQNVELVVEVAIQYRLTDDLNALGYARPVFWNKMIGQWDYNTDQPSIWSEPIYAYGGKSLGGPGSVPATDAHKSAVTDGLTKAASFLGVAHKVFKGLMGDGGGQGGQRQPSGPPRPEKAMTPSQLREHLSAKDYSSEKASKGQIDFTRTLLVKGINLAYGDTQDDQIGPDLLEALWGPGFRVTTDLTKGQCGAMINNWLLDKASDKADVYPQVAEEIKETVESFRDTKPEPEAEPEPTEE
jgi:hypothetical protein